MQDLEQEIDNITSKYQEELTLLKGIPGVSETSAAAIIAETGLDMSQFPTSQRLTSWVGVCPGSYESAGKKK